MSKSHWEYSFNQIFKFACLYLGMSFVVIKIHVYNKKERAVLRELPLIATAMHINCITDGMVTHHQYVASFHVVVKEVRLPASTNSRFSRDSIQLLHKTRKANTTNSLYLLLIQLRLPISPFATTPYLFVLSVKVLKQQSWRLLVEAMQSLCSLYEGLLFEQLLKRVAGMGENSVQQMWFVRVWQKQFFTAGRGRS